MRKAAPQKKKLARAAAAEWQEQEQALRALETPPEPSKRFRPGAFLAQLLQGVLLVGLGALCAGVFYIAVILGETPELQQGESGGQQAPQQVAYAAPASLPGGSFQSEDLATLHQAFPGPLAVFPANQGFQLTGGEARDMRVAGQDCRAIRLTYSHPGLPLPVVLISAMPAAYLQRYTELELSLTAEAGVLAGLPAVAVRLPDRWAWLARQGELLFVLEAPLEIDDLGSVAAWTTLQAAEQ